MKVFNSYSKIHLGAKSRWEKAGKVGAYMEIHMDTETVLTKEKAEALYKRIEKGIQDKKISGSFQMIGFAIDEAWRAGFEEGEAAKQHQRSNRHLWRFEVPPRRLVFVPNRR